MTLKEEYNLDTLISLQKQMRHEDKKDNDSQASPRFWMIMDYREVVGNEDYDNGETFLTFSNGDFVKFTSFDELKEFLIEHEFEDEELPKDLQSLFEAENPSLDDLSAYVLEHCNEHGYYDELFLKEEEFLVPNTFFLTKEAARAHLDGNKHHYTSKAHTYAMTAWRSPGTFDVYRFLHQFDFESLREEEGIDKAIRDVMVKAMNAGFTTFINYNAEVIIDKKWNVYFGTSDIRTLDDVKRKVLSCLSYYSVNGVKPKRQQRYLELLNKILDTRFTYEEMELIYRFTGNGIHRELADAFVKSGFDMQVMYDHRDKVDQKKEEPATP